MSEEKRVYGWTKECLMDLALHRLMGTADMVSQLQRVERWFDTHKRDNAPGNNINAGVDDAKECAQNNKPPVQINLTANQVKRLAEYAGFWIEELEEKASDITLCNGHTAINGRLYRGLYAFTDESPGSFALELE